MINSMTGFAVCEQTINDQVLAWELRSVNHRYLDVSVRLPSAFRALEAAVREQVGLHLKRGKVECTLVCRKKEGDVAELQLNRPRVQQLLAAAGEIEHLMPQSAAAFTALDLLAWPDVLLAVDTDPGSLSDPVLDLLRSALLELSGARRREGEQIHAMIEARCALIAGHVADVCQRRPAVLQTIRERLQKNLDDLLAQPDQERLEQEMVYLAQKLDVAEELDRLQAHVIEVGRVLARQEPVGRRLDFLMQEMNREANTLGSKSADTETTRVSVELKVLIEQMREQVQNIE